MKRKKIKISMTVRNPQDNPKYLEILEKAIEAGDDVSIDFKENINTKESPNIDISTAITSVVEEALEKSPPNVIFPWNKDYKPNESETQELSEKKEVKKLSTMVRELGFEGALIFVKIAANEFGTYIKSLLKGV